MAFQAGQSGHLDEHNKWHQFLDDVKDPNKKGQYPGIEGPPGLDGPIGPAGPGAEYQPDAPTQRKDATPLESGDIWVDSDDVMFAYELLATGTAPANPLDGQLWFNTGTNILHRFEAASNNWVPMGVSQGPVGPQGPPGPQGIQGPKGDPSSVPGPKGDRGDVGATGAQGPKGDPSTVPGPQGPKGDRGIAGPTGPVATYATPTVQKINPGSTPSITISGTGTTVDPYILALKIPEGQQGIQGVKGDKGDQGPKPEFAQPVTSAEPAGGTPSAALSGTGTTADPYVLRLGLVTGDTGVQGVKGDKGDPGTSVTIKGSVATAADLPTTGVTAGQGYLTSDTGHLHVHDGTKFHDVGLIRGPQGIQGVQGPAGVQGPKGDQGVQGLQGVKGDVGPASTVPGPAGPKGDQGIQGIQGIQGPKGDKGDTPTVSATASTLAAGSAATAVATPNATGVAVEFGVPKGDKGDTGATGPAPKITALASSLPTGSTPTATATETTPGTFRIDFAIPDGAKGVAGLPARMEAGSVTALAAGTTPTAQIVQKDATTNQWALNLGLPQGTTGANGPAGAAGPAGPPPVITVGTVKQGAPGSTASATLVPGAKAGEYTLDLTIPAGATGATGAPAYPSVGATDAGKLLTAGALGTAPTWQPAPVALPNGGTTGQVLAKKSGADGDSEWVDNTHLALAGSGTATTASKSDHTHNIPALTWGDMKTGKTGGIA